MLEVITSEKTSSQIARSIIDLAVSLKTKRNTITIYLIKPLNDHLNNRASKVNSRLVNTCGKKHIPVIARLLNFLYTTFVISFINYSSKYSLK